MSVTEEISFAADISQLMNLIVNSFYSKKEIFLRELLSNSSDALEKIRYESLTHKSVLDGETELKIRIKVDKENNKLMIYDTGLVMTKEDLINCLGTIAKSGTKSFFEKLEKKNECDTIGQFGVGFYSSYLVADRVKVVTKNNNDDEYIWESNSDKTFTITKNTDGTLVRGTEIYLYLKEDEKDYLDTSKLREIVKRYTEFINYPIEIWESKEVEEEVDEDETETEERDETETEERDETETGENDEPKIEDLEEDDDKDANTSKKEKKKIKKIVENWEKVNDDKPIWSKKPEDVTEEEYKAFYKKIANNNTEMLSHKHFCTEGQLECNCILYIPEMAPFDMFQTDKKKKNIKLYVKKVFIMDDCDQLVPEWLKFMVGIVDSNDIQLNVSREILQQSKILNQIKNIVTKKSIELFVELSEDEDKYNKFYESYDKMIKLGIHEDSKNRDKLVELLRYATLNNKDKLISLKEYVNSIKEDQTSIYFICGDNKDVLEKSPLIEKLKKKGYDVLYFVDPIDEYMIQNVREYDGKKLVDVSKEGIKFDEDKIKERSEDNKELLKYIKDVLGNRVTEVKITDRLSDTPCVLVTSEFGWTANMEKIMKSQALRDKKMDQFMGSRKILEVNPDDKIIMKLCIDIKDESNREKCTNMINFLYDNTLLVSGFYLEDPTEYAKRVFNLMKIGFCDEYGEDEGDREDGLHGEVCQKVKEVSTEEVSTEEGVMEEVD